MSQSTARDRRLRDRGLDRVSSGTRWLAAAGVMAVGAFSAAFALPQLLEKAQAKTDPPTSVPATSAPDDFPAPVAADPSPSTTVGGLSAPSQPPVTSRHRSRAVTGAS
jgi:hypothetical protein